MNESSTGIDVDAQPFAPSPALTAELLQIAFARITELGAIPDMLVEAADDQAGEIAALRAQLDDLAQDRAAEG